MADKDDFEGAINRSEAVAEFEDDRQGLLYRVQHALHVTPSLVPLIVLVAAIAIFGLALGERFFSASTLTLILQQVQIVGVLAAAQTLIVLTAGIDLSVGAIAVLCSVLMGRITFFGIGFYVPWMSEGAFAWVYIGTTSMPATLAIIISLAVGTGIGAVSGWLVSRVKLPPFIVTLGMWQIVLATNYLYSRNETIRSQDIRESAALLGFMGNRFEIGGAVITFGVVTMIAIAIVLAYTLSSTSWGRHVYAVGDDPEAAELAGVDRHKTLMSVYMLAGLICAIAGWVMIGRLGSVSPAASTGVVGNIQSITAVVIGGISLFGGRGSIWGAFFGALIVGTFELGLRMSGANAQWT
ncbi:MAG: ABC transporter permease, partial [Pseudomonadota bacterium]